MDSVEPSRLQIHSNIIHLEDEMSEINLECRLEICAGELPHEKLAIGYNSFAGYSILRRIFYPSPDTLSFAVFAHVPSVRFARVEDFRLVGSADSSTSDRENFPSASFYSLSTAVRSIWISFDSILHTPS